jgi:hypothetical protein
MNLASDPETRARRAAFLQGLQELGWTDGRNVQVASPWQLSGICALVTLAIK